jgi:uncharacterized protein YdhG (YjbR/CyaY superfamily)
MAHMQKTKSSQRSAARKGKGAPKNFDEYFASVAKPARGMLKKMRAAIRSAMPREATETISYGMPAFEYEGMLVWYAAFANHCSLFPSAAVIDSLKKELSGLTTSKGTVQFPVGGPLPITLVRKIVKKRIAQMNAKKRK